MSTTIEKQLMVTIEPPPSRLLLLRHAKSGWAEPGQRDFDRMLDDAGFAEAELVASKASDRGLRPDLVISSTAVRCRQTADAIRRAFGEELDISFVDELYNAPLDTYIALLAAQSAVQSLMIIGHNPAMEELLEALIGHDRMAAVIPTGYPTAGLSVLDHGGSIIAAAGTWQLKDFVTP